MSNGFRKTESQADQLNWPPVRYESITPGQVVAMILPKEDALCIAHHDGGGITLWHQER
jgi:hypothetical protein